MRLARIALMAALIGAAALYVAMGASQPWDLETYYYAATACRAHLNPYDPNALSSIAGKPVELPFLYPPIALLPFMALSVLPFSAANLVWLILKILFLAGLIAIWRRGFLREVPFLAIIGVTLFGFNAAALWDLRTGNVAIVEALLLWGAFSCYTRGRVFPSAGLISLASIFKIAPIAFLGLLFVGPSGTKKKALAAGVGIALLAGLLVVSWPLTVRWAAALARSLVSDRQTGEVNPSALGILDGFLGDKHRALALSLFVLFDCAVALAAFPLIRRLSQRGSPEEWVMVAVTLWILLSPRAMIYSYVLMIVPALFVLRHGIAGPLARALGYVLLMVQGLIRLLPGRPPAALAEGPFLLTLAIFALLLARVASTGSLILPLRRPRNR